MPKIFVSTVPFGEIDSRPLEVLQATGWEFVINPLGRKLTPQEVGEMASACDGLIAGTEDVGVVLDKATHLKIVCRVGIGLDSVPLAECRRRGIVVTYTPDAVTKAVAELTVGAMIGITRFVPQADRNTRDHHWKRLVGKRIGESVIGLLGLGRIGTEVVRLLAGFGPKEILVNDLKDKRTAIVGLQNDYGLSIRQAEKDEIYSLCDVVSLHLPLSHATRKLIDAEVLKLFRPDAFLLNFARGGVVDEAALYDALKGHRIAGAAVDVFGQEPYSGPLTGLDNILLTQHMGSCSYDCRAQMELQATEDLIRFFRGEPLVNEVPEEEYAYQEQVE